MPKPIWEGQFHSLRAVEGLDIDKYAIATYYVETPEPDLVKYAEGMAVEQTTGTWTPVPGETIDVRERSGGKIVGIYRIRGAPNSSIVRIAYPVENWGGPNLGVMLSTIFGNVSHQASEDPPYATKVMDVDFPQAWLKEFKGPKFGLPGIREILKIPDRPILNAMIKPCIGHSLDTHIKIFRDTAFGGVDIIKDDELLADPKFNPFFDRLSKCLEICDKKEQEMNEKTLYTINATDNTDKMLEKCEKAIQSGANALMINSSHDIMTLKTLADDPSIKVPILYHICFAGNYTVDVRTGMAFWVFEKLARIAGADICLVPDYWGKFGAYTRDVCLQARAAAIAPLQHIKPLLLLPGGGVHPGLVPHIVSDYGKDILIGAGGAVHGHPMGATGGGKALRQAIDAVMKGEDLREYAKTHKELKAALDKWGYPQSIQEATQVYDLRGGKKI